MNNCKSFNHQLSIGQALQVGVASVSFNLSHFLTFYFIYLINFKGGALTFNELFQSLLHKQSERITLMGTVIWILPWCSAHFLPVTQERWRELQTGKGSRVARRWPPPRRPGQTPRVLPPRQTYQHPNRYVIESWFFFFCLFFLLILDQKRWNMISVCDTVRLPGCRWVEPAAAWPRWHRYGHSSWHVSYVSVPHTALGSFEELHLIRGKAIGAAQVINVFFFFLLKCLLHFRPAELYWGLFSDGLQQSAINWRGGGRGRGINYSGLSARLSLLRHLNLQLFIPDTSLLQCFQLKLLLSYAHLLSAAAAIWLILILILTLMKFHVSAAAGQEASGSSDRPAQQQTAENQPGAEWKGLLCLFQYRYKVFTVKGKWWDIWNVFLNGVFLQFFNMSTSWSF